MNIFISHATFGVALAIGADRFPPKREITMHRTTRLALAAAIAFRVAFVVAHGAVAKGCGHGNIAAYKTGHR